MYKYFYWVNRDNGENKVGLKLYLNVCTFFIISRLVISFSKLPSKQQAKIKSIKVEA